MIRKSARGALLGISLHLVAASLGAANPWDKAFGSGVSEQEPGSSEKASAQRLTPSTPRTAPASKIESAQALADAQSLVATFNAAVDAGASVFSTMRSPREVIAALATGVRGAGRYADTTFHVPGLDQSRQAAALQLIRIERGRIMVGAPAKTIGTASPPDPRSSFAGGKLKLLLPAGLLAEDTEGGDLLVRGDGATMTVHLEAMAEGLDAWGEVRSAAERASLSVSMAGKKVYVVEPDKRAPKSVTIGFGKTLVSMAIEGDPASDGYQKLRFALPGIIGSLSAQ